MKRAVILAGVLLVLSGCGQKGPLYLPDKKPPAVTPPATAPAPAPAGNAAAPKKQTDEDASQTPAPK
jgi:predicted small lipoprotein YifL